MKLYYLEDGIFPSTFSFKDEADGAFPSGWGDLSGGSSTVIVASDWQGHRKVLKCTSAGGGLTYRAYQEFTAQADGDIEFFIGSTDCTNIHYFCLTINHNLDAASMAMYVNIEGDVLYATKGDGAGGSVAVNMGAITDNMIAHIHIHFDAATDTFSCWRDGTLYVDAQNFFNDNTFAADELNSITVLSSDVAGAICYFDAIAYSWDTDYNIGDNLEVDWHDPYNKESITDIDTYPIITPRLNTYCQCNTILGDFEGAKFDDWYARDFNKILIEDDSGNIIFRGFLIKKIFTKKDLTLYFAGIGALLDWSPFGAEGTINYILAEGLVAIPIPATSILTVKTDLGAAFTWNPDWWISEGRDVGILIIDQTDVNTRTWQSSAISQVGGTVIAGNNASTLTFNDDDYYHVRQQSGYNFSAIVTPVIDAGIAVDDTDFLKSIEIQYSFRLRIYTVLAEIKATIHFEILKDTEWIPIASKSASRFNGGYTTPWVMGIPLDVVGGNGNEEVIEDTDAELQKYFTKVGATYDKLKGLRFRLSGTRGTTGIPYGDIHVDYIKVKVGYMTDDISPIMESITDNAASTITCADVSAWDETGVVENDGFRIGENTRVIIQDIATQSGIDIKILGDHGDAVAEVPDGDVSIEWDLPATGTHYDDVAIVTGNIETETYLLDPHVDIFTVSNWSFIASYCTNITVYARVSIDNAKSNTDIYIDLKVGGAWQGSQALSAGVVYAWKSVDFPIDDLTDAELDSVEVKIYTYTDDGIADPRTFKCSRIYLIADLQSVFNKYMAREFKGNYCMEPLKAVCKLEGAIWYEDYINDRIILVKPADLVDSGVVLTEADYEDNWEYEDDCNQVKSFYVFGKSEDKIFAKVVDETVSGYISKQLIDESITNVADAQLIADTQLALVNSKKPSIRLPLKVDNVALQLGYTVDVTFARPTIAKAAYPIRKIERKRKGINEIVLTIWIGLGESSEEENVTKFIRDNMFRSHKGLTDRLISP